MLLVWWTLNSQIAYSPRLAPSQVYLFTSYNQLLGLPPFHFPNPGQVSSLSSLPPPFHSFSLPYLPPLEVGPLNPARVSGGVL